MTITVYGRKGWGSVFIEAQLEWYQQPYKFVDVGDLFRDCAARDKLREINPLAQVPCLVYQEVNQDTHKETSQLMTESAAITLWLSEWLENHELIPEINSEFRADFLRWLVFIVTNIYPTYTYVDDPSRFVTEPAAQKSFANQVNQYAKQLYSLLEENARGPWFLGASFSAIDIYIAGMTYWRPGREWFAEHTPMLYKIAGQVAEHPKLNSVFTQNFSHLIE